jgi:hypothetical protein
MRAGNPVEYGERQQKFAGRHREEKAYTATIDAVTAALLLGAEPATSKPGKALLSDFASLFVNIDNCCLEGCVQKLVPRLQALFNSLSDDNLKAMVEMVVALSSKENCNVTFVNSTIGDLLGSMRAVNNANCARALTTLGQAVPPTRALSRRANRGRMTLVEVGDKSAEPV